MLTSWWGFHSCSWFPLLQLSSGPWRSPLFLFFSFLCHCLQSCVVMYVCNTVGLISDVVLQQRPSAVLVPVFLLHESTHIVIRFYIQCNKCLYLSLLWLNRISFPTHWHSQMVPHHLSLASKDCRLSCQQLDPGLSGTRGLFFLLMPFDKIQIGCMNEQGAQNLGWITDCPILNNYQG